MLNTLDTTTSLQAVRHGLYDKQKFTFIHAWSDSLSDT